MRWLAFLFLAIALGQGQFRTILADSDRFRTMQRSEDWEATNVWLASAECARTTGAWLAICDHGKLVPISEVARADDPGHALLLGLWAKVSTRKLVLLDVVHLNIALNTFGLVFLASFLFAIRAYVTTIVLLALGPVIYLGFTGASPHWGCIGVASMAAVLLMSMVAREKEWLSAMGGHAYFAAGLVSLAIAALVREPIGIMALLISLGTVATLAWRRRRAGQRLAGLAAMALLVVMASAAPKWAVMSRDMAFDMQPAQHIQTPGISHTLYIGLGVVPNRFGIPYDDLYGAAVVKAIAPDVIYCSPEYFRIVWKLYLDRIAEDPLEVARIYLKKAETILADSIIEPGLPLAVVLTVVIAHLLLATYFRAWRAIAFPQGFTVEFIVLVFIGFFVAQAILGHPSRLYAFPVGPLIVVLLGSLADFGCRWLWVVSAPARVRIASAIRRSIT